MQQITATQLDESLDPFAFDDVSVTVASGGQMAGAELLALAPQELRLRAECMFPRWTTLAVSLHSRSNQVEAVCVGTVHWCQETEAGWEVGIWLDEEVPEDIASAYWQDMRREIRYSVNWGAVAQWPGESRRAIKITNYSLTGMAFVCSQPVASSEEFLIWRSFDCPAAAARAFACWHTVPTEDCYLVGCRMAAESGFSLARAFSEPLRDMSYQPLLPRASTGDELSIARSLLPGGDGRRQHYS